MTLKGLQIVFTTDLKYIEDDIVHRDDTRAPELLPIVLPGQRSCSSITSLYCPVKNEPNEHTHEIKIDACLLETYICAKMHYFFWSLIYVSGQNDRETRSLSGQCSLTGRYCEPWQNIERGERVSPVERR